MLSTFVFFCPKMVEEMVVFYLTVGRLFLFKEALEASVEVLAHHHQQRTFGWSHQVVCQQLTVDEQEVLDGRLPSIASYMPHYQKNHMKNPMCSKHRSLKCKYSYLQGILSQVSYEHIAGTRA